MGFERDDKEVAIVLKGVSKRRRGLCGIKSQSFSVRQLKEKKVLKIKGFFFKKKIN